VPKKTPNKNLPVIPLTAAEIEAEPFPSGKAETDYLKEQRLEREKAAIREEGELPGSDLPDIPPGGIFDPSTVFKKYTLTTKQLRFVTQLVLNGWNISRAEKALGLAKGYGYYLARENAGVRAVLEELREGFSTDQLRAWGLLLRKAQDRLEELLDSKDDRVALLAVREIFDRGEGRAVQKVIHESTGPASAGLDPEAIRLAFAAMFVRGWQFAQAYDYVLKHREEVREWAALPTRTSAAGRDLTTGASPGLTGQPSSAGGSGAPPPSLTGKPSSDRSGAPSLESSSSASSPESAQDA